MAKRRGNTSVFDDEVVEVSRAGLPETGSRTPVRTILYKGYVWFAVCVLPLALLALVVVAAGKSKPTKNTAADGMSTATSSAGRTAATLELQSWLSAKNSPLPGGQILSWDKAVILPAVSPPKNSSAAGQQNASPVTYKTELDSFSVIDQNRKTYTATVQVAIDPRGGGAQAMGGPSLIPTTPAAGDDWAAGGPWPGLPTDTNVSSSVDTAISGWANAYTSGSADALRLAVGDTASGHTYLPLSDVKSVAAAPVMMAHYGGADSVIVEVTLDIVWVGQKVDPNDPDANAPLTTMDLLIQRASTAAPVVTAWGAPGSGTTLKPYQNAVTAPAITPPSTSRSGN